MRLKIEKLLLLIGISLLSTTAAWAYDKALAESYEQYFTPFSGKATPKALQMINTPDFVKSVKAGEKLFILDIRTPAETGIYGLTIPGSIAIPMDQVFKPDNLARIPTEKKVVVVCKAGHRAMAVGTALRHAGFSNVYVLKHGFADLAQYLSPKNAY